MSIEKWLGVATTELSDAGVPNPRLDCLVILEDTLERDRSSLLANPNEVISSQELSSLDLKLQKRKSRIPLAYIRGIKEFYGLEFDVNQSVLIPRPETEDIVELVEALPLSPAPKIADIGTGSGNIAITLAKRNPEFKVYAYDIDQNALLLARRNAEKHNVNLKIAESDLLAETAEKFEVIIANLPYVDPNISVEPELLAEPKTALFAKDKGLELIKKLIAQINTDNLAPRGWVILESHKYQHNTIAKLCLEHRLKLIQTKNLIQILQLEI